MAIAQGSTPYLMITVEGYDLTDAAAIEVSIKTSTKVINFDKSRITVSSNDDGSLLVVLLSQEETLSLEPSVGWVQVRWRNPNNRSYTTEMAQVYISSAIYRGVI